MKDTEEIENVAEEMIPPPPILGKWSVIYGIVLGVFVAEVLLFFWIASLY